MNTPEPATLEDVLTAHVKRTRSMFKTIAAMFMVLIVAMGVGSYFLYQSLSNPNRVLTIVQGELHRRDVAAAKANEQLRQDFCLLLRDLKQTPGVVQFREDIACPGTKAAKKLAQQDPDGDGIPNNTPSSNPTAKPDPNNPPKSNPPKNNKPPTQRPTPRPSQSPDPIIRVCLPTEVPVLGRCVKI